jgi:plasmid stability protein
MTLSIELDPAIEDELRRRAAEHGRSIEAEVREILSNTLSPQSMRTGADLVRYIQARFAPLGGLDIELPEREPAREPPTFD